MRAHVPFGAAERAGDYTERIGDPASSSNRGAGQHSDEAHRRLSDVARTAATAPVRHVLDSEQSAGSDSDKSDLETSTLTSHSKAVLLADIGQSRNSFSAAKATRGLRGALASLGLPVAPSAAERAAFRSATRRAMNETTIRQATWTRAVSILVNNPKGGTGKTPIALLLGGTLASVRGGSTAVVEFSDDPGALTYRAEGTPRLGLGELVRDIDTIRSAGQLHGYTAPQTSFADVIGSTGRRDRLTGEAVVNVSRVIDEYYGIRVMDTGNVPTSAAFHGAVSVADVLVIPVMNAGDSVLEAVQLLDELHDAGGPTARLADHAVAFRLTDGRPENSTVRDEVTRLLNDAGIGAVHEIPYDPHIAERGQLTLASLAPATRDAFTAAAADVIRSLQDTVTPSSASYRKA